MFWTGPCSINANSNDTTPPDPENRGIPILQANTAASKKRAIARSGSLWVEVCALGSQ